MLCLLRLCSNKQKNKTAINKHIPLNLNYRYVYHPQTINQMRKKMHVHLIIVISVFFYLFFIAQADTSRFKLSCNGWKRENDC